MGVSDMAFPTASPTALAANERSLEGADGFSNGYPRKPRISSEANGKIMAKRYVESQRSGRRLVGNWVGFSGFYRSDGTQFAKDIELPLSSKIAPNNMRAGESFYFSILPG